MTGEDLDSRVCGDVAECCDAVADLMRLSLFGRTQHVDRWRG